MGGSLISVVEAVMDDGGDDGDGKGLGTCSRCGDGGSGSCSGSDVEWGDDCETDFQLIFHVAGRCDA